MTRRITSHNHFLSSNAHQLNSKRNTHSHKIIEYEPALARIVWSMKWKSTKKTKNNNIQIQSHNNNNNHNKSITTIVVDTNALACCRRCGRCRCRRLRSKNNGWIQNDGNIHGHLWKLINQSNGNGISVCSRANVSLTSKIQSQSLFVALFSFLYVYLCAGFFFYFRLPIHEYHVELAVPQFSIEKMKKKLSQKYTTDSKNKKTNNNNNNDTKPMSSTAFRKWNAVWRLCFVYFDCSCNRISIGITIKLKWKCHAHNKYTHNRATVHRIAMVKSVNGNWK